MRKIIVNILFALALIVMALVLTVTGTLICAVKVLEPHHLTPLAQRVANQMLDADVSLGRLALAFDPAFPILRVQLDSVTVVSHAFKDVPAADRGDLPEWADTLAVLDHFSGALNINKLLAKGEISLHDVLISGAGVNIVLDKSGRANFDIYHSTDTTATDSVPSRIPPFSLDHFDFRNTRLLRYYNAADGQSATVLLLRDAALDGTGSPSYKVSIEGHLNSPVTRQLINLEDISFGLDGEVHWTPADPGVIVLDRFNLFGAFLRAEVGGALVLDTTLTVNKARVVVEPVAISDALTLLPDSIRRQYRLVAPFFRTDGAVAVQAELLHSYSPALDSVPAVQVDVSMADCSLVYGKADLRRLGFDVGVTTDGISWDATKVNIRRFTAAGPATSIVCSGTLDRLLSDPAFDAVIAADMDLRKLPPVLAAYVQGYISGRLKAQLKTKGTASMFSQQNFHRLQAEGLVSGSNIYYLSNDTAKMVEANGVRVNFDSHRTLRPDSAGRRRPPMLSARVAVDTATLLINGVNLDFGKVSLNAGTVNAAKSADTTIVVPVGGALKVGSFNVMSITDSAGARMRNLDGRVMLHRFKGKAREPELRVKLDLGRVAAGAPAARFMLRKGHLEARIHRLPGAIRRREKVRHRIDSVAHANPYLSPDSVMRIVYERRKHRPHVKHVEMGRDSMQNELIEWELAKGFRRFLLEWQLDGKLTSRNARLFTPAFPLRNRVSRLELDFSTDSIRIANLRYRAGRSDMTLTGLISNIRRGLTSPNPAKNSLKINLRLQCDTIDVNQLSAAVFAGEAYRQRVAAGAKAVRIDDDADEDDLDRTLDALVSEKPDSIGPVLIPTNLDGRLRIKANHVFYADMDLTDLRGDILVYDGGLNLNKLGASSPAGSVGLTALYSAPRPTAINFGFGLDMENFNIERFLKLVPAVDSVMPIMRDFSGIINANLAATVDIDSTMNLRLNTLDAALRLTGDSLAFINKDTYAKIGKWLRFRDRADNTIKHINVEMVVRDNVLQIFPFSFDIDRYRLGVVGYNDLNMNFDYHIAVLKSPIPFKFGVTIKGNPKKYKVRLGGAKFKEGQVAESVAVVDTVRVNLMKQIEGVFRRGVSNSRFSRINLNAPDVRRELEEPDPGISHADSLSLIREGIITDAPEISVETPANN